jgi:hypothetical protein
MYSIVQKNPKAYFFQKPSLMYFFFVFNFQDFILCVKLMVLQILFIRIKLEIRPKCSDFLDDTVYK